MPDREKVIKELDKLADEVNPWKESPPLRCDISYPLLCDAIALLKEQEKQIESLKQTCQSMMEGICLLKEQEAVEPEVEVLNEIDKLYRCPKCHKHFFYEKQKYCDQCGQAVKWK